MGIERDQNGAVVSVGPARGALHRESVMHFEVERRLPEEMLPELEADVARVLGDVRLCVRDFHAMADRVQRMIEFAEVATARYDKQEVAETVAFLHWLIADNFVFLGYREYAFPGEGDDQMVQVVHGSGLGILSDAERLQLLPAEEALGASAGPARTDA